MPRYRHQPIVITQNDQNESGDFWLKEMEKSLQKDGVQPVNQKSIYDQINSIMNGGKKSKYTSVQNAVDDMMSRSGMTNYLKTSQTGNEDKKKTASDNGSDQQQIIDKQIPVQQIKKIDQQKSDDQTPEAILHYPAVLNTLRNYIHSSRGNLPVPAIISKLHSLHHSDVPDEKMWEDDKLIRLVSKLNLQAKRDNPHFTDYHNLALQDNHDQEIDPSNNDAFNALMPSKK